jgi:cytochrome c peroxidase
MKCAMLNLLLTAAIVAGSSASGHAEDDVSLPVPLGSVKQPAENPTSPAKTALGRELFFDARLSRDGRVSCASCHQPDKGFSNGERFATGVGGKVGTRKVPRLVNVGFNGSLFWDGRAATLEAQALMPIENPGEMDMRPADVAARLNGIASYGERFQKIFGGNATPERIAMALAAFERTLVSDDTPFDRYLRGDKHALPADALRGMRLFFGEARCAVCHKGPTLSDDLFHNIGAADPDDAGRQEVTGKTADHGAFRTPQLREVGRTSPYMHNGRFKTLRDVVRHYNFGGVTDQENDQRDTALQVLYLADDQVDDLVAFLDHGLTTPSKVGPSPRK